MRKSQSVEQKGTNILSGKFICVAILSWISLPVCSMLFLFSDRLFPFCSKFHPTCSWLIHGTSNWAVQIKWVWKSLMKIRGPILGMTLFLKWMGEHQPEVDERWLHPCALSKRKPTIARARRRLTPTLQNTSFVLDLSQNFSHLQRFHLVTFHSCSSHSIMINANT